MTTIGAIVMGPLRRRERWAWWATASASLAWFVLDTGLSLILGYLGHGIFNVGFAHTTILEYCKPAKPDVPSGTARELAELMGDVRQPEYVLGLNEHVGDTTSLGADVAGSRVHAVRLPGITEAAVEVLFGLPGERLTIRHDAEDTTIFVGGSLLAAQKVGNFKGLVGGLNTLLFSQ